MKKIIRDLKHLWPLMVLVCLISLGAISTAGCAGKTKSSTVTTQTTDGVPGNGSTTTLTTQKVTETSAHPRGVIGGVFYTIGQILIWPFKLIGSLFS